MKSSIYLFIYKRMLEEYMTPLKKQIRKSLHYQELRFNSNLKQNDLLISLIYEFKDHKVLYKWLVHNACECCKFQISNLISTYKQLKVKRSCTNNINIFCTSILLYFTYFMLNSRLSRPHKNKYDFFYAYINMISFLLINGHFSTIIEGI